MKAITATNSIDLKKGMQTSTPFIKLIKYNYNAEHERVDCVIEVYESRSAYADNEAKKEALQNSEDSITAKRKDIKNDTEKLNQVLAKKDDELAPSLTPIDKKVKAQIAILIEERKKEDLETRVDALEEGGEAEKSNKAIIEKAEKEIDKQSKIAEKIVLDYDNAKIKPIAKRLKDTQESIKTAFEDHKKLPQAKSIDTKQYPCFESAKELDEDAVFDLIKKQYKGVKVV